MFSYRVATDASDVTCLPLGKSSVAHESSRKVLPRVSVQVIRDIVNNRDQFVLKKASIQSRHPSRSLYALSGIAVGEAAECRP